MESISNLYTKARSMGKYGKLSINVFNEDSKELTELPNLNAIKKYLEDNDVDIVKAKKEDIEDYEAKCLEEERKQ